ncbi:MAG: polysaccharide deacetylase family protein [Deltaproteobacteria bacterium]|nr:polysaccharide deacetylase family protein [Deltaproteobacteria bacterium]MCW5806203.1 polysaccharide deacetylase family protein [Deltaproteobacteria bacterium]
MRDRVASLLHRAGALDALMRLRKVASLPSIPIVTYHQIADRDPSYPYDPDVADATPEQFRRQMELLARTCTSVSIDDLVRAVDGEPLPRNAVMITFDDGYQSCHDIALPILKRVGMKATFFIPTMFVTDRKLFWWERVCLMLSLAKTDTCTITYPTTLEIDRRTPKLRRQLVNLVKDTPALDVDRFLDELAAALDLRWNAQIEAAYADGLIMTWDQIRALANAGMDIESHGRRHRVLQTLDAVQLHDELFGSKDDLEAQLDRPVRAIAYPVGRRINHEPRIREACAAAGYRIGMSNQSGVSMLWPTALRGMLPVDPFDVSRLATDRDMSDALFLSQIAIPGFAYPGNHPH